MPIATQNAVSVPRAHTAGMLICTLKDKEFAFTLKMVTIRSSEKLVSTWSTKPRTTTHSPSLPWEPKNLTRSSKVPMAHWSYLVPQILARSCQLLIKKSPHWELNSSHPQSRETSQMNYSWRQCPYNKLSVKITFCIKKKQWSVKTKNFDQEVIGLPSWKTGAATLSNVDKQENSWWPSKYLSHKSTVRLSILNNTSYATRDICRV